MELIMNLKYICRECGATNEITSFWKWFWTPHFGAKKWLKCKHCEAKRHFMKRQDGCKWLDWPKNK
jgi:DNA-directed RNA polymerase subunit RPC12/RpoP